MRVGATRSWLLAVGGTLFALGAFGQTPQRTCDPGLTEPNTLVDLPGSPFSAVPTADSCWIFVSLQAARGGEPKGIAVVARAIGGNPELIRVIPTEGDPAGMILTHDGKTLIVAATDRVLFLDAGRLVSGAKDTILGSMQYEADQGSVYVNVTPDDRLLFVSEEGIWKITVINLEKARNGGFQNESIVGQIPVGNAPIALTFSPDGKLLYTTSQHAPPELKWLADCAAEGPQPAPKVLQFPQGAVMVVDVARAKKDPPHSVVAIAPAGCNPVRLALSPKGDMAYVTARGQHALLAFNTRKLVRDPKHARVGLVATGTSPVGIALTGDGRTIVVTNSNRFSAVPSDRQSLTVIAAAHVKDGASAVLGSIPAGAFPRELRVTADQRTLLVTNYFSKTLQLVDLARLSLVLELQH